jgi:hypothetical protein
MVYYSLNGYNEDMFLVGILSWWYGDGWRQRFNLIISRLASTSDYFSIGLLLSTLFAPYRQISAGGVKGPVGVQLRAFADRLISRFVGLFVRLFMIIFGLVALVFQVVGGAIVLLFWPLIPIFPVIGLIIFATGWAPIWL